VSKPPGRNVGLVGGIASGKSLAAAWFARQGWTVVDADRVAHGLYAPGTALASEIVRAFGDSVRASDGGVDRKALGNIVFGDPDLLQRLEALVHPALRQSLMERMDRAEAEGEFLVLEMALLSRWPAMAQRLDDVVGISAPEETRLARLMARNGLSLEAAAARMARQGSEEGLLACATLVVRNEGTLEDLEDQLSERFGTRS
jgi:dephospho-CoA kinase